MIKAESIDWMVGEFLCVCTVVRIILLKFEDRAAYMSIKIAIKHVEILMNKVLNDPFGVKYIPPLPSFFLAYVLKTGQTDTKTLLKFKIKSK